MQGECKEGQRELLRSDPTADAARPLDSEGGSVTYNGMVNTDTALVRAARFRERQRAKGLRPATIWIPDIRDAGYRARLDAACRELATLSRAEGDADAAAGLADAFKYITGWQ